MSRSLLPDAPENAQPGLALVQVDGGSRWLLFQNPVAVIQTAAPAEAPARLREASEAVERHGLHAAGYIAYEAAPGFDPAMPARPGSDLPLLWFGLYRQPQELQAEAVFPSTDNDAASPDLHWQPDISRDAYDKAVARIKEAIARGDTYQVNFTFPLHTRFDGAVRALFSRMLRTQRCRYAAYLDTGSHVICSASPELFWELDGRRLTARPMKGTAARGRSAAEDEAQRDWLLNSAKNRAENVMIVDMVRNDMGRIARYGSVHAPALFQVERYPTVWQMTSTVACETDASTDQIMAALFPCASITGAPKVRTMQLIDELEAQPRGVYTGCIGMMAPGRRAQFNVAIRTVVIDRATETATYGVGGGVVWDSQTDAEYDEALLKAQVLTRQRPVFDLLETLRWTPRDQYFLLDRHVQRLNQSAAYFDVPLRREAVIGQLDALAVTFDGAAQRVRVLVSQTGVIRCEAAPLAWPADQRSVRVGLAPTPVDSNDLFLYHKTTYRAVYEAARRACPDCDDVLLWNERGEVTETSVANIAVQLSGELLTPPVACGLLAGTLRGWLLEQGRLRERVVTVADLAECDGLYVLNSVRGVLEATLAENC